MTATNKDTNNVLHSISWPMKLAIALFLLPLFLCGLAVAFKLPLPTFPGINVSGGPVPEYVAFMSYRPEAVRSSVIYSVILTFFGFILMVIVGLKNCGYTLQHDVNRFFAGFLEGDNQQTSGKKTPGNNLGRGELQSSQ